MILRTRKEQYLNEIVGNGNTAPGTPYTREELFFADILGEVVAPSPITRAEKYLAKIANKYSGELPEPVTRIERFLARAAGMDVTIPTPITREEMLWANYALIVEKELSGIPPLTFNAVAGTLKNYRIYGNTVNGESVGDRTANLFDISKATRDVGYTYNGDGDYVTSASNTITGFIAVDENTTYTIKNTGYPPYRVHYFDINKQWISRTNPLYDMETSPGMAVEFTTPNNSKYIMMQEPDTNRMNLSTIMLNTGSEPLPYEPYGYKVPVTVIDGTDMQTTTIYLDAPLAKPGNNADYIDYATQKRRNSDGTESSVTLPEIAVTAGTNTLTVGTEVQPSNVYIKYEGER